MSTMTDDFMLWWEKSGCLTRSGGGDYERTFAFEAWRKQATRITKIEAENERLIKVSLFKENVADVLRAQLANAKKDADRWEYSMQTNRFGIVNIYNIANGQNAPRTPKGITEFIDAAIQAEGKQG